MLGYYDYTVWLTYASLVSAGTGILVCLNGGGHPYLGIFFLMICGLCDAFDGKVARSKKNRTDLECKFGIQIDSLADLVAFGVLPACIGDAMIRVLPTIPEVARRHTEKLESFPFVSIFFVIMVVYMLATLIRLAYFNVQEEERQKEEGGVRKYYSGLPVTSAALIFPVILSLQYITPFDITPFYFVAMLLSSLAFLMPIPVKKPTMKGIMCMVAFGAIIFIALIYEACRNML
ncbi:MAG: phosphatidylserine synthase [Lachnospiraceae bacterium]|jgi:CDP-diacylglycerol--serine O-phosphatidyltransferase|nr:phosphatidylserine synthase [Lachnospiraceae bacterium]